MISTGYHMHKIIVGYKPEESGPLHAIDGMGAKAGINITDSDYNNESPAMAGLGLRVMLLFLMFVGLYSVALFNVFMYFEWKALTVHPRGP